MICHAVSIKIEVHDKRRSGKKLFPQYCKLITQTGLRHFLIFLSPANMPRVAESAFLRHDLSVFLPLVKTVMNLK